jgi:CheY-like chemotaxis protein
MIAQRVLVVDDDPDVRSSLCEVLLDAGYLVDLAADGREALELLGRADAPPRVILLDLMMPGMSGGAFLEALRRMPSAGSIAVIVLTGYVHSKHDLSALRVAGHLRKPVRRGELIKAIARVSG